MSTKLKIAEKSLHQIWTDQDFTKELKTPSGDSVNVLNPGIYNEDSAGPDFKNARIKIGNLTFVGDVEIDPDYNDWKNHGHNINKHYNKVILHLCYTNKQKHHYVYTVEGRKVNSITLYDSISIDNIKFDVTLAGKRKSINYNSLKCSGELNEVNLEIKRKYLLKLGVSRFQNKCDRIYRRLKELKFIESMRLKEPLIRYELTKEFNEKIFSNEDFKTKDLWEQLLYELVFEALGYSKNKNMMMKLAQNVNLNYFKEFKTTMEFHSLLESAYFNISGLMPELDETDKNNSEYLILLNNLWKKFSSKYDGKTFDETQWQFLGQRPQNFPTIRISGGANIAEAIINKNLVGVLIKKFTELNSIKVLINSIRSLFIVRASGYWREHYIFDKKSNIKLNYIIGLSRADEIFVNVLLPYLSVYFAVFGNEKLSKKVLQVFNEYDQRVDNKIIRTVTTGLLLDGYNKKAIYSQGMIELFRNYCSKNRCLECEIGKIVFR